VSWVIKLLRWLSGTLIKKIAISIPLPSFYRHVDIKDSDDVEDAPEVGDSREYAHANPLLIRRYLKVEKDFIVMCPGKKLLVTSTYRSPEVQRKLYVQGRFGNYGEIVTNCDGTNVKSKHNEFPSRALDVAVLISGKATWDETIYYPLGPLCTKHKLEWGGYKILKSGKTDFPHISLPKEIQ